MAFRRSRRAGGHILVQGKPLRCRSDGSGKGSRTAAWCSNDKSSDLSRAMVKADDALKWDRYWNKGHAIWPFRRRTNEAHAAFDGIPAAIRWYLNRSEVRREGKECVS